MEVGRELGMAALVPRDAHEGSTERGIARTLGLERRDERAVRLEDAAFGCVLERDRERVAARQRGRERSRGVGAVATRELRVTRAWRTSSSRARRARRTNASGAPSASSSRASRSKAATAAASSIDISARSAPVSLVAAGAAAKPSGRRPQYGWRSFSSSFGRVDQTALVERNVPSSASTTFSISVRHPSAFRCCGGHAGRGPWGGGQQRGWNVYVTVAGSCTRRMTHVILPFPFGRACTSPAGRSPWPSVVFVTDAGSTFTRRR